MYFFDPLSFLSFPDPGRLDGDTGVGGGAAQVLPDRRRVDELLLGRGQHAAPLALPEYGQRGLQSR